MQLDSEWILAPDMFIATILQCLLSLSEDPSHLQRQANERGFRLFLFSIFVICFFIPFIRSDS